LYFHKMWFNLVHDRPHTESKDNNLDIKSILIVKKP
jgi:hypothetical protein